MLKMLKKIFNNDYLFSVVAKFFGVFTGMFFSVLFTRYLGAELRGEFAIISNYVTLFAVLLGVGIYQAYPFFKKTAGLNIKKFVNNVFSLFVIYEIIGILIALYSNIEINMKIAAILVPIAVLIKQLNYVVLVEKPKRRNLASIILSLIEILMIASLLLTTKAKYLYLIIFIILKEIVNLVISFKNLHMKISEIRLEISQLFKYAKYGVVSMITLMFMTINYRVDILMLNGNVSVSEIGIYSLGVSLAEKVWLIPDALKDILISRLSKGKSQSEVSSVIKYSLLITIMSTTIITLIGKPIIILLFGREFQEAYLITVIMMLGVIGMIFYKMVYSYNVVNGHKNINLVFLGMAAIINVVSNYIMIPLWGIYAAAMSSVMSYSICGILFLVYFQKQSKIKYREILIVSKEDLRTIVNKIRITLKRPTSQVGQDI